LAQLTIPSLCWSVKPMDFPMSHSNQIFPWYSNDIISSPYTIIYIYTYIYIYIYTYIYTYICVCELYIMYMLTRCNKCISYILYVWTIYILWFVYESYIYMI
jgi:hypothetical protein